MNYYEFIGKTVRVTLKDGHTHEGYVFGHTNAYDNEPEIETIDLLPRGAKVGMGIPTEEIAGMEVLLMS